MYFTRQLAKRLKTNHRIYESVRNRYNGRNGEFIREAARDNPTFDLETWFDDIYDDTYNHPAFDMNAELWISEEERDFNATMKRMRVRMTFDATVIHNLFPSMFHGPQEEDGWNALAWNVHVADLEKLTWIYTHLAANPLVITGLQKRPSDRDALSEACRDHNPYTCSVCGVSYLWNNTQCTGCGQDFCPGCCSWWNETSIYCYSCGDSDD